MRVQLTTATDGAAALDQRGLRPCAILLDLMMPRMDGWDFRQQQIKDDELKVSRRGHRRGGLQQGIADGAAWVTSNSC
jgi:CheY-like chemotaxis protein